MSAAHAPHVPPALSPDVERSESERLRSLAGKSLRVGAAGLALLVLGAVFDWTDALRSWLVAWFFVLAFPLGSLALLQLHNATGGAWGVAIRRPCEAAVRTLPVVAAMFVPVLLLAGELYPWADPDVVAADPLLQHKQPFLDTTVVVLASLGYFAVWFLLARVVAPVRKDDPGGFDRYPTRRQRQVAGLGLVAYVLTMTFASFHWSMSLEPHWFSTIYGLMFVVGQTLAALALSSLVVSRLDRRPALSDVVTKDQFHDLGNLTLALVMLWAYVALSQYLIIWSANLAEEAPWYEARGEGGWSGVALLLIVCHFALPFLVLLSRTSKRAPAVLGVVALWMIAFRAIDIFWIVMPAFHPHEVHVAPTDPVAYVGLAGLWGAAFLRQLASRPLVYRPEPPPATSAEAAEVLP